MEGLSYEGDEARAARAKMRADYQNRQRLINACTWAAREANGFWDATGELRALLMTTSSLIRPADLR